MEGPNMSQGTESMDISKEQVIDAYKNFVTKGVKNPDSLDPDDSEVKKANELFYKWIEQGDAKVQGDSVAEALFNFEKTIFYVDIGFDDPDYLHDVLGFLDQDLHDVEENEAMVEVKTKIETKIREIEEKLGIE